MAKHYFEPDQNDIESGASEKTIEFFLGHEIRFKMIEKTSRAKKHFEVLLGYEIRFKVRLDSKLFGRYRERSERKILIVKNENSE